MLSADRFFRLICNSIARGHSFKLFLPDSRVRLIVDNIFFRCSCAENLQLASRYPEMLITADHLSLCIRRLERVKLNQSLIGEI